VRPQQQYKVSGTSSSPSIAPRKVDRVEVADRAEVDDGDGRAEVDGGDRAEVDGDFEAVEGAQRGMGESASRSPASK